MRIWGRDTSGNVRKVLWCCDELALTYDRVDVGGSFGGLETPEYRALNPNSRIPTIDDDGFILWESNTIVRYLSAKYASGTLCPSDLRARADVERWMDWQLGHLLPSYATLFLGIVRTPAAQRDDAAIERARLEAEAALKLLDRHLATRRYVGGDDFTMGDIPLGANIHRWYALPIERPAYPHLQAWYRRLCERPAYQARIMAPF